MIRSMLLACWQYFVDAVSAIDTVVHRVDRLEEIGGEVEEDTEEIPNLDSFYASFLGPRLDLYAFNKFVEEDLEDRFSQEEDTIDGEIEVLDSRYFGSFSRDPSDEEVVAWLEEDEYSTASFWNSLIKSNGAA